jgi:hypothetical protein
MEEEAPKRMGALEALVIFVFAFVLITGLFARFSAFTDSKGLSPGKAFQAGEAVVAAKVTDVLEYPSGTLLGQQLAGAYGVITDGPKTFAGARRWFVDFANAPDGWVDEADLSLTPDAIQTGGRVHAVTAVNLYDAPNGNVIGSEDAEAGGVVVGGPVTTGNIVWWEVQFDDGKTGWVEADSLAPDPAEQNRFDVIFGKYSPFFIAVFRTLAAISFFISFLFIFLIVYSMTRIKELSRFESERHHARAAVVQSETKTDQRFDEIHKLVSSENPNDWRQAIIQADVILDELLRNVGYHGESVGDKLKQVRSGDLSTIDAAWQAHKVRNDIAHRGSDFILTRKEAERSIALYRRVFEELGLFG